MHSGALQSQLYSLLCIQSHGLWLGWGVILRSYFHNAMAASTRHYANGGMYLCIDSRESAIFPVLYIYPLQWYLQRIWQQLD